MKRIKELESRGGNRELILISILLARIRKCTVQNITQSKMIR